LIVKRTDVAPLPSVASQASEGEVIQVGQTTVFAADDVIYVMRRIGVVFA
jgi:hypothetical protein